MAGSSSAGYTSYQPNYEYTSSYRASGSNAYEPEATNKYSVDNKYGAGVTGLTGGVSGTTGTGYQFDSFKNEYATDYTSGRTGATTYDTVRGVAPTTYDSIRGGVASINYDVGRNVTTSNAYNYVPKEFNPDEYIRNDYGAATTTLGNYTSLTTEGTSYESLRANLLSNYSSPQYTVETTVETVPLENGSGIITSTREGYTTSGGFGVS